MADTDLRERPSWIEGAAEEMSKRIDLMERLHTSIDRKLWAIIVLVIGAIVVPLVTR